MSVPDHPFDELALFLRWKRLGEAGEPADPEELCRDKPELLPRLREMIRAYEAGTSDATLTAPTPAPTASAPASGGTAAGGGPAAPGFELVRELGRGGMGLVFEARDRLGRHVALKVVGPGVFYAPQLGERLQREARAMARLEHDRIATVFESGEWGGWPYYTMRLFRGGTLGDRLAEFRADPRKAVALMAEVTDAIAYLHGQGYLHRDLKPSNVLLDEQGRPHVADFGLVKLLDEEVELTATGAGMGTPQYMAPEQLPGSRERAGPASDVWALGVILFELLAGKRPFDATERSEIYRQILHDPVPSPREANPALDAGLERIIRNCLAKRPEERYALASQLAEDLRGWLAGQRPQNCPGPVRSRLRGLRHRVGARPTLLAGAAALVLALLAAPGLPPETPPRLTRAADFAQVHEGLAGGKETVLVDAAGQFVAGRWTLGNGQETAEPLGGERGLRLRTQAPYATFELAKDPQWRDFLLEAEVLHVAGDGTPGVYFAHNHRADAAVPEEWFCRVSFADRGKKAEYYFDLRARNGVAVRPRERGDRARLGLDLERLVRQPNGSRRSASFGSRLGTLFDSAQHLGKPASWRTLRLHASPEKISLSWGNPVEWTGEIAAADLQQEIRVASRFEGFQYTPWGALGLYVGYGTADFRNVRIKPLRR